MRNEKNKSIESWQLILLLSAVVLLAIAGISKAFAKNEQVRVARKIRKVQKSIEENQELQKMEQIKIDRSLNRYIIRESLIVNESKLERIQLNSLNIIGDKRISFSDSRSQ